MDSVEFLRQYTATGAEMCDDAECGECAFVRNVAMTITEINDLRQKVDILSRDLAYFTNK